MEKSSFFNSINGDRKYKAEDFANYFNSLITNGVFPNPSTNLQILSNNNMTVTVKAGKAWINGYVYINESDLILPIEVADGVLNRIDRIVIRLDTLGRNITAKVKKGTFASSPTAQNLQRDADSYELALADIYIGKGIISIVQANITDLRQNQNLCGIVSSLITPDTATLFNQFEDGFNTWFNSIKNTLSGDVAANIVNDLNSHKADYVAQPANGGTTGGTATAYTITTNPIPTALIDKIGAVFTVHVDSGANPTLQWGTLAAKPIKKPNGNAAVLKSGGIYTIRYNATTGNFILQGEGGSGNATASDLLSGKTASTDAGDIVGTMPNLGSPTYTPTTVDQIINGFVNNGKVKGDVNLIASNILSGKSIFGVAGSATIASLGGKRFATGTVNASNFQVTVSTNFTPELIFMWQPSDMSHFMIYSSGFSTVKNYHLISLNSTPDLVRYDVTQTGGYVNSSGFKLTVFWNSANYSYLVYGS